jgi:hypothetical protein
MDVCAVCTDRAAARVLHRAGLPVVLLGPPGADLGRLAAALRASGTARVAVFVGDPNLAADRDAATAMAEEQFRAAAVVVSSPLEARALVASMPGRGG